MNSDATKQLISVSHELGFQLAGVCHAVTPAGFHQLIEWVNRGYAGEMGYLSSRLDAYQHPDSVLQGVRSMVVLGMNYFTENQPNTTAGTGKVARYAWGEQDYHDLIHERLKQLKKQAETILPGQSFRGVVDTAPLLERELGQLAGLGWVGKNTLLLNRDIGSYFFLAVLLTDAELDADEPFTADHCGSCTACLDACPTQAFPQPYLLDARRCISYLTIEHRSEIDADLLGTWDDWFFGCDVCQEVCPWNRRIPTSDEPMFRPTSTARPIELCQLFYLTEEEFRLRFRKTPLWRAKRRGVLRNAALVLGSQRFVPATSALEKGCQDPDALVRESSHWALKQIQDRV